MAFIFIVYNQSICESVINLRNNWCMICSEVSQLQGFKNISILKKYSSVEDLISVCINASICFGSNNY